MTTQIISAIALSVIAAVTVIGYVSESRRLDKAKKKSEFYDRISRELERASKDNKEILRQYYEDGIIPDDVTNEIVNHRGKEIEQMIEQYKRM